MEVKMNWIPYGVLLKYVLKACSEYEKEHSARFRCRICWTNNHTMEEHEHPPLSQKRQADLAKWQATVPFLVAAVVGFFGCLGRLSSPILMIEWLFLWPVCAWVVAYRFHKAQIKENERFYRLLE